MICGDVEMVRKVERCATDAGADADVDTDARRMAYGMGRPAILREDETIHQCRRLLEHPMSITSDARLVSTVELMALRGKSVPLHSWHIESPRNNFAAQL
jgi:hypothetical protein